MMLSENPDVEEFSGRQHLDFSESQQYKSKKQFQAFCNFSSSEWVQVQQAGSSEFSKPFGENFSELDLIQTLLSLESQEERNEAFKRKTQEEPDLLQQLLVLEGEGGGCTSEVKLIQGTFAEIKPEVDDNMTEDEDNDDTGDDKKENEDHNRQISTAIYKTRWFFKSLKNWFLS